MTETSGSDSLGWTKTGDPPVNSAMASLPVRSGTAGPTAPRPPSGECDITAPANNRPIRNDVNRTQIISEHGRLANQTAVNPLTTASDDDQSTVKATAVMKRQEVNPTSLHPFEFNIQSIDSHFHQLGAPAPQLMLTSRGPLLL